MFYWYLTDLLLLLRLKKMCGCGDIYWRWKFKKGECSVCYYMLYEATKYPEDFNNEDDYEYSWS